MKYGQPRGPWIDAFHAKTALPGSAGETAGIPPTVLVVAQLISLTTWANAFLRRGFDAAGLNRDHSTLRVCNKVAFADIRGLLKSREVPIAADPLTWLKFLREEGCASVRLRYFFAPDPAQAGEQTSNAAESEEPGWRLETLFESTADRWRPRWQLTNRYAAQNRNWSVVYTRVERKAVANTAPTLEGETLRQQLGLVLQELQGFAVRQNQTQWSECQLKAKSLLELEKPFEGAAYPDLLPRVGGAPTGRQMLAACCQALLCDVDKSISPTGTDPEQNGEDYNRLTAALHTTIAQCVEHSANLWVEP